MSESIGVLPIIGPKEAADRYGLSVDQAATASPTEQQLGTDGIARIAMPLSDSDFGRLVDAFETCIEGCPKQLGETFGLIDSRYGSEVGYVRKEQKTDSRTGLQTADPKSIMQFHEATSLRWRETFAAGPLVLRNLLDIGDEIHHDLTKVAQYYTDELEATHPNISRMYFPVIDGRVVSRTVLRVLSYDGYEPTKDMGDVAKPHFDVGGLTIQAYADAPGFWAAPDGVGGQRIYHDTSDGEAYFFAGAGHRKVYGSDDPIRPLWHGVDRITSIDSGPIGKRHTAVLFIDAPGVDYGVRPTDTLPQLRSKPIGETGAA